MSPRRTRAVVGYTGETTQTPLDLVELERGILNRTLDSTDAAALGEPCDSEGLPLVRTSEVLRGILTKNPGVKKFSVQRILASIGPERLEASLMMFSIPAIVPIPAPAGMVTLPTGALARQLASGLK